MREGRNDVASRELAESKAIDPGAGTILNLAFCYEKLGRTAQAWIEYGEAIVAAHNAGRIDWERAARARAAQLEPTLRWVVLHLEKPETTGLEISIDGALVATNQLERPIPVDRGEHEVRVASLDKRPWSTTFESDPERVPTVVVPELAPVEVSTAVTAARAPVEALPRPAAPPHAALGVQRALSLVVAGLGVGALAASGGFGLSANSRYHDANCDGTNCTPDGIVIRQSAAHLATFADVFAVTSGVLFGGAAALWWISPHVSVRLAPTTGASGVGMAAEGQW
jgi:hypothetical protein